MSNSHLKVTSNSKGRGQEKNPFERLIPCRLSIGIVPNPDYDKWQSSNPPLPLISQNGDVVMEPGEYTCEKINQRCPNIEDTWPCGDYTREAYQIAPAQGEEKTVKEMVLHIHISDNASPELIKAIEKMVELAYNQK